MPWNKVIDVVKKPFKAVDRAIGRTTGVEVNTLGALAGGSMFAGVPGLGGTAGLVGAYGGSSMFSDGVRPTGGTGTQPYYAPGGYPLPGSSTESTAGEASDVALRLMREAEAAGERAALRNIERFPQLSSMALESAMGAALQLDDFMQQQMEKSLDGLYPEWRTEIIGAAADAHGDVVKLAESFRTNIMPHAMESADAMSRQALSNAAALLRGDIPDDVAAQIQRHSAEVAQQIGVRGQAAQYLTARDLGMTSLDLQQRGLEQAPHAFGLGPGAYAGLAETAQMPMQSGMNMANLMSGFRAPSADPTGLYGGGLNVLTGHAMVGPGQTQGQTLQAQQMGIGMAQFGLQRADALHFADRSFAVDLALINELRGG